MDISIALFEDINILSDIYCLESTSTCIEETYVKANHMYLKTGDVEYLTESLSDITSMIVNAIRKCIAKIKEFFNKILAYINSYLGDYDTFVEKNKKVFDNIDNVDFTISGFNFSISDYSETDMSEFDKVVDSYNEFISDLSNLDNGENKNKLVMELHEFMNEDNLDNLRGKILGIDKPIEEENFLSTVRETFRSGDTTPIDIHVNKKYIDILIANAKSLVKQKNTAIKERDEILKLLKQTETFFARKVSAINNSVDIKAIEKNENKFGTNKVNTLSTNNRTGLNIYQQLINLKYNQVNKIYGITSIVVTEKVNALKDQIKQETLILKRSLTNGKSVEDKVVGESYLCDVDYTSELATIDNVEVI